MTHGGGAFVFPEAYMAAAAALRPDVCYLLADESFGNPSKRRADAAVQRSGAWLERCLELAPQAFGADAPAPLLIATVPGAAVQHQGRRAAAPFLPHDGRLAGGQPAVLHATATRHVAVCSGKRFDAPVAEAMPAH